MKPGPLMLDTSVCIALLRSGRGALSARAAATGAERLSISSIVLSELAYGAANSADPEANAEAVAHLLRQLAVEAFDAPAAMEYGRIRVAVRKKGSAVGQMDLLIGAHAIARGAGIATLDTRDFGRIPGLRVESWAR